MGSKKCGKMREERLGLLGGGEDGVRPRGDDGEALEGP